MVHSSVLCTIAIRQTHVAPPHPDGPKQAGQHLHIMEPRCMHLSGELLL